MKWEDFFNTACKNRVWKDAHFDWILVYARHPKVCLTPQVRKYIFSNENLIPGLLKTRTLGYDGKGQYKINSIEDFKDENINFNKGYILEKLVKLKKEISVNITRFKDEKYETFLHLALKNNHKIKHTQSGDVKLVKETR